MKMKCVYEFIKFGVYPLSILFFGPVAAIVVGSSLWVSIRNRTAGESGGNDL